MQSSCAHVQHSATSAPPSTSLISFPSTTPRPTSSSPNANNNPPLNPNPNPNPNPDPILNATTIATATATPSASASHCCSYATCIINKRLLSLMGCVYTTSSTHVTSSFLTDRCNPLLVICTTFYATCIINKRLLSLMGCVYTTSSTHVTSSFLTDQCNPPLVICTTLCEPSTVQPVLLPSTSLISFPSTTPRPTSSSPNANNNPPLNATTIATATATPSASASHCCSYATCIINKRLLSLMGCVYTTSSTHVTSSFLTDQCNPPLVICTTLCEPSTVQPVLLPSTSLISFPSTTPRPTSSSPNANNNPSLNPDPNPILNATTIATATATPSASASHCCSYATCIINKRLLSLMGCVYTTSSTHVTSSFLTDRCNPLLVICTTFTVQPVLLLHLSHFVSIHHSTPYLFLSQCKNNNPPLNATTIATATATPSASASHCCSYATCIINKRLLSLMGCVYTTSSTRHLLFPHRSMQSSTGHLHHIVRTKVRSSSHSPTHHLSLTQSPTHHLSLYLTLSVSLSKPRSLLPTIHSATSAPPSTSLISFPSTTPRPTSSSPNANNNPPLNANPILNATTIATATATPSASASHCCSYATCIINKRLLSLMGCVYTTSSTHVTSSFLTDQCNPPLVICTTLCEPSTVQPVLLPSTSLISFPSTTPHPTSSSPNANNNPPLNDTTIATANCYTQCQCITLLQLCNLHHQQTPSFPHGLRLHHLKYTRHLLFPHRSMQSSTGHLHHIVRTKVRSSSHSPTHHLSLTQSPTHHLSLYLTLSVSLSKPRTVQPVLLPSTSLISFPSTTPRPTSSSPNANNNPPLNPNPNPNPNPDPDPILNATTIATATATPSASASHCCSYATCIINKRLLSLMGCVYTTSSTHVTSSFLTDRCNPLLVICTTFTVQPVLLPSTSLISFPSTTPRPTSSSPNANNNPPLNPNPNPNPNPDPDPILNATTIATATATPSASASHCCSYATCIINKRLLSLMGCVYTTSSTHVTSSFLTDRCNPLLVICTTL
ncbi:hypothetical protein TcWFU_004616 [Taenia crassiceps]|uniref:Uncharacterized protein n=1 Tax=Taenia crassiceps TaxID=6207 RepID=A0ABR4PZM5_9CEST